MRTISQRIEVVGITLVALSVLAVRGAAAQKPATPRDPPLITAVSLEDSAVIGSNRVAAFRIQNRSTSSRSFHPKCAVSAELVSCVVRQNRVSLRPGEMAFVIVRYKAGRNIGNATLTLKSTDQAVESAASLKVLLHRPPQS